MEELGIKGYFQIHKTLVANVCLPETLSQYQQQHEMKETNKTTK